MIVLFLQSLMVRNPSVSPKVMIFNNFWLWSFSLPRIFLFCKKGLTHSKFKMNDWFFFHASFLEWDTTQRNAASWENKPDIGRPMVYVSCELGKKFTTKRNMSSCLFCLWAHGQCRIYYIYHVECHFRFKHMISFPV